MAASKLVIVSLFLALIFTSSLRADVLIDGEDTTEKEVAGSNNFDSSSLKIELDQLKSRIHSLETQIYEKTRELKSKDVIIAEKEKIIQEKSNSITSLQNEISSLQKKGTLDAAEQVGKAHAKAVELEKQVENLKKEVEAKNKEKEALEAGADEAEKKISVLILKLENLERINDEQKSKIRKTERALKMAEEELMKAKFEATSKTKELTEVHGAWLPPWLAVHLIHFQSFVGAHWNEHGKPAVDLMIQKALEKKSQAEKWAEPLLETVKTKWIPVAKDQLLAVTTYVEPHVQLVSTKMKEAYETSKIVIAPHVIKVQQSVDPYFQEAKKFTKPYIDQVATVTKPHVDKVRVAMKPYTKQIVRAYERILKSANTYHRQVQSTVQEMLKNHELTRPLATRELEWFAASALLALPIIILFRIFSAAFCGSKRTKRPSRHANHHSRRKPKRGHPDK